MTNTQSVQILITKLINFIRLLFDSLKPISHKFNINTLCILLATIILCTALKAVFNAENLT